VGFDHASLDLANAERIRTALEPLTFDALVNCAAQTNVDFCETHEEEAMRVNADAVAIVGTICRAKKARCIHISTDYIFDGEKRTPYTERDVALPLGIYGASKLAGETVLAEANPDSLTVRVSCVFGPDRPSFVDQILNRALEHADLAAVADKWAVPTYTLDIAQLLFPFVFELPTSGVLHLCNGGSCTWQEYGQYAIDVAAKLGVPLVGRTVAPLAMADLKAFVAKRPVYTVMSTERLTALTGAHPRPWQEAVEEHVRATLATSSRSV
jgi:dTDP-4-dehydrorhamnose reductase